MVCVSCLFLIPVFFRVVCYCGYYWLVFLYWWLLFVYSGIPHFIFLLKCFSYFQIWATVRKCTLHSLLLIFGEYTMLANLMSTWHQLEPFWKRTSTEKVPPPNWPVGKAVVPFLDWRLMCPVHYWQHYPLAGDPWYCKEAGWASHRAKASIPPWPLYHLLPPRFLSRLSSCPDFFADELWCRSIREINPFLPKLLMVMMLYHSNRNPN